MRTHEEPLGPAEQPGFAPHGAGSMTCASRHPRKVSACGGERAPLQRSPAAARERASLQSSRTAQGPPRATFRIAAIKTRRHTGQGVTVGTTHLPPSARNKRGNHDDWRRSSLGQPICSGCEHRFGGGGAPAGGHHAEPRFCAQTRPPRMRRRGQQGTYDGQLQKSTSWSGLVNGSVSWTYNADFLKVSETVQAGTTSATAAFGYDNDGLLTCASPTTCPSGAGALTIARNTQNALLTGTALSNVTDAYTYNTYGELATYVAKYGTSTLYSVTYDATGAPRDALGRVVKKTETLQGTTHAFGYTYDVQGRLTDVTRDGTAIEHYGYDLNGNRMLATVNSTTVNPTYDDQDRLLTYGDTMYTYTANGEILTKVGPEGTTTYTYDAMGSLIAVQLPDGRLIQYITDGRNRRIGKMVDSVLVKQWLYRDELKPAAELDGFGNIVGQFVYGTKPNVPDYVIRGGATYRVISDQLGSPVLAVNVANSSDIPLQATYAAFGERTLIAGTDDWMPFGFAGGLYDPDTKLTRFGARDYDAKIGRWVSKDPIRFDGGQGNIYVYNGNDPLNRVDSEGTGATCKDCLACNADLTPFITSCVMATGRKLECQMIRVLCVPICAAAFASDPNCPPPPDPRPPPPPPGGCEGSSSRRPSNGTGGAGGGGGAGPS
jgi:RHS repeat-associated protein